jgi:hypothetical protein
MGTREGAAGRSLQFFDSGAFRDRLAELVGIPSTSQDPGHEADVQRYLDTAISPWLERLGFTVAIHANLRDGFGPILTAERLEDPSRPTVLTYGHGAREKHLPRGRKVKLYPQVIDASNWLKVRERRLARVTTPSVIAVCQGATTHPSAGRNHIQVVTMATARIAAISKSSIRQGFAAPASQRQQHQKS